MARQHLVYYVYCHRNRCNGKAYIGWTCNLKRRWNAHLRGAVNGSQYLFPAAIRKWGSGDDIWDHQVLEVMTTLAGVKHAEVLWIAECRTFAGDKNSCGYNQTRGGDGVTGLQPMLGHHHSLATRQKMSHISKGKKKSPTHCVNIGRSKRGVVYGERARRNMGLSHTKRVVQFDLNGNVIAEFVSMHEASISTGIARSCISRCCSQNSKRKTAGGFMWKIGDDS